ncbi:hypothetical protein K450DRAFT_251774 [Umbelopsis ramanniana AG]|uniref:Calponin-homology (CH) domain-containing protein n=1 Tax=Umbelopsis ramanniana AG TaxID=1314678 RepID=A0AAD5E5X6_UMBRA|nr:uncharacterized protein K450DRAFT_251774 [Umbelopsis ramanniana AG]KAI8577462.1 hypothetical protein K450DRAFT_251774 [Umbelopsis ramanniana AG]
MLGFSLTKLSEEPEDLDRLPTPIAPPPSWHNLDVETDLDVLMQHMFDDIEIMLTAWAIIVGPPSESEHVQILPLLQTVTEMLNSVKNYILHRHDLTEFALGKLRNEALKLLETMSHLETKYRALEDGNSATSGYLYNTSDFGMLDRERTAILAYLDSVEKHALNPPHHVGSPYAGYSAEIKKLMTKTSGPGGCAPGMGLDSLKVSSWVDRKADWESELARSYAMIVDTIDTHSLTDPRVDRDAFLQGLTDGIILCTTYNSLVKKSRRSFGLINKIHHDTLRTYRATENLSFFAAACKFRFDTVFIDYKPADIARKTPAGLDMLEDALNLFTSAVVKEFNFSLQQTRRKSRFIDVASLSIS